MLQAHTLKGICSAPLRGQVEFLQRSRSYSSRGRSESEEAELAAARIWFNDNKFTIPEKIAKTDFSRSSGAGGQKVNKTSSKATTVWDMDTLAPHVPKVLHEELRGCRYYNRKSNTLSIQSDVYRNQPENKRETFERLSNELTKLYKNRVPGVTLPEKYAKVEEICELSNSSIAYNANKQISRQQHKQQIARLKGLEKTGKNRAKNEAGLERRLMEKERARNSSDSLQNAKDFKKPKKPKK